MPEQTMNKWTPTTDLLELRRLGKLGEELGEAASVAARCIIQGIDATDPASGKINRERLENELADVQAQIGCTVLAFALDQDRMAMRTAEKMRQMAEWEALFSAPGAEEGAPMPKLDADKMVRYCPECGLIGPVKPPARTCCPDSLGMSLRRWQAEKLERMLERLRSASGAGEPVDVLALLQRIVKGRGSQKAAAAELGVSEQHLSDVLNARREPGKKLVAALHVERVVTYRPRGTSDVPEGAKS